MGRRTWSGCWLVVACLVVALAGCGAGLDPSALGPSPRAQLTSSQSGGTAAEPSAPATMVPNAGVPSVAELSDGIEWQGRFSITLEVWNYCGSGTGDLELTLADTYTLEESFSFSTSAPAEVSDGARESNPFSVSAGTNPDDPGRLTLSLFSAALLTVQSTPNEPYLQQYWDLAYDEGVVTGELIDDGRELGAAFNGFFDEDPLVPCQPQSGTIVKPYTMAEQTTLVAQLRDDDMSLTVQGRSFDEARRFRIEAVATRSS